MSESSSQATAGASSGNGLRVVLLILAIAAAVGAGIYFDAPALLDGAIAWIDGLGIWGPVIFILLYILATVFFLPGSILTLGAGTLFGVVNGTIYVSIASTLGATAAFLVGRYLARDWVAGKIEGNRTFSAIDEAVATDGWKIVGLTRLSPVFPFNLLNYAFGLTKVRLRDYFFASWIGMLPGTIMYVYLGSIGKALTEGKSAGEWTLFGFGLLATVVVTVLITKKARAALNAKAPLDESTSE